MSRAEIPAIQFWSRWRAIFAQRKPSGGYQLGNQPISITQQEE